MSRYSLDGSIRWTRSERIQHLLDRATAHLTVGNDWQRRGHRVAAAANYRHADAILRRLARIDFRGSTVPGPEGLPQPADGPVAVKGASL